MRLWVCPPINEIPSHPTHPPRRQNKNEWSLVGYRRVQLSVSVVSLFERKSVCTNVKSSARKLLNNCATGRCRTKAPPAPQCNEMGQTSLKLGFGGTSSTAVPGTYYYSYCRQIPIPFFCRNLKPSTRYEHPLFFGLCYLMYCYCCSRQGLLQKNVTST